MKKIPTIFIRDHQLHVLTQEPNPFCDWVFAGEGRATRKFDGTPVMVDARGDVFKRYEVKPGNAPPEHFQALAHDETTGKTVGWIPLTRGPEDKYIFDAIQTFHAEAGIPVPAGTYEACGPKIQGNPEGFKFHRLILHGSHLLDPDPPRDYEGLQDWLSRNNVEGIVWHHPDGRMAKIKGKDFRITRGIL